MKKNLVLATGMLGLLGCVAGSSGSAGAATPHSVKIVHAKKHAVVTVDKWLRYNQASKVVDLKLVAGVNNGFNFNGFQDGQMVVTVPVGWEIDVTFTNGSSGAPHSSMIVPVKQVQVASGFTPAFKGAATRNPTFGTPSGTTQKYHFVAARLGKYGIICAVPGHDAGGMWDYFVVSAAAKKPTMKV